MGKEFGERVLRSCKKFFCFYCLFTAIRIFIAYTLMTPPEGDAESKEGMAGAVGRHIQDPRSAEETGMVPRAKRLKQTGKIQRRKRK